MNKLMALQSKLNRGEVIDLAELAEGAKGKKEVVNTEEESV